MKKVNSKVKIIALTAGIFAVATAAGYTYRTNAEQYVSSSDNNIELNVEKQDRDTVKIYLSNFSDLAKSFQLSVKIDGNVKFNESSIKWLVNQDSSDSNDTKTMVKTDYKINEDKKEIDFFIVSNEPINSDNGLIEICEIDVSKSESIIDKLFKSSDGSYRVVPNDGDAYSYVTYSTNKNISGNNIINSNDNKLTINTNPVIRLKNISSVVGNKIIISKGTSFKINDYVEAYDADEKKIDDEKIKYTGNVDSENVGSYNIVCEAEDSYGDKSTLEITVIVEDTVNENIAKPVISGADKTIEIIAGESFDLKYGITAKDYMGRSLEVTVTGDFDTEKPGTYILIYSATDRFNNTVTVERTLIVKEKANDSEGSDDSGSSGDNSGGSDDSNGSGDSDNSGNEEVVVPDDIANIITEHIKPVSGNGTSTAPLLVEVDNEMSSDNFMIFINKLEELGIESKSVEEYNDYKILKLKILKKSSMISLFNSINSDNSSDYSYISIKVDKENTSLINVINNFIGNQNGGTTGGSGSSNGSSSSSGDEKYEIPSQLENIINTDIIKPISGDGTSESPLVVKAHNISSQEFIKFTKELSKFEINIESIENYSDTKIANLRLSKKSSMFNLFGLFKSSSDVEDIYLSIKVDKSSTELIAVLDDFIAKYKQENSPTTGDSDTSDKTDDLGSSDHTNGTISSGSDSGQDTANDVPNGNNSTSNKPSGTTNNNTSGNISNSNNKIEEGTENTSNESLNSTSNIENDNEEVNEVLADNSEETIEAESNDDKNNNKNNDNEEIEKSEGKEKSIEKIILNGILLALAASISAAAFYFKKKNRNKH